MLIVHVVRQFHPGVGGLENGVLDLASAQVRAGNRVRVVTLDRLFDANRHKLRAHEEFKGIEIVRIPYFGSFRYPVAPSVLGYIKDADLVHVHAIDFFFDYLALTRPFHRRRLVVSTHGGFFHTSWADALKRLWFSTVTRLSLKAYAAVIAVSPSDFARFKSLRRNGMAFIENGANVDRFYGAASIDFRKSIMSIGRFAKNKRIDLFVDFARALLSRDPDWKFTIAGRPGDLTAENVNALIEGVPNRGALEVMISPSDDNIRARMRESSFVASASDYEGFGMSVIEGMSAGLFPILSDIPPFRRLVDRTGLGMILDFSNPELSVLRLLENLTKIASNYAQQRAACITAALRYDWPYVCEKVAAIYDAVLGNGVRTILDVPIQACSFERAVELIDARFETGQPETVAFANAHTLNLTVGDRAFRHALQHALVFNDGVGVDIASRVLYGSPFPENLNGTDFNPNYLRSTRHRYRIFLLGAKPGTAQLVADRLTTLCPRHKIAGSHHGYFHPRENAEIAERVRRSGANLLLVAMGNPKQELWLHEHLADTGCALGIGVGALFDFIVGDVQRAPERVRLWRLEWVYRLAQEPRRLAHRYLVGNPLFLSRILLQWWSGERVRQAEPAAMNPRDTIRHEKFRVATKSCREAISA
jgi:alpha-1,3-mannosyltransferase